MGRFVCTMCKRIFGECEGAHRTIICKACLDKISLFPLPKPKPEP